MSVIIRQLPRFNFPFDYLDDSNFEVAGFDISEKNDTVLIKWRGDEDVVIQNIITTASSFKHVVIYNASENPNSLLKIISHPDRIGVNNVIDVRSKSADLDLAPGETANLLIFDGICHPLDFGLLHQNQVTQGYCPWIPSEFNTTTERYSKNENLILIPAAIKDPLVCRTCDLEITNDPAFSEMQVRVYSDGTMRGSSEYTLGKLLTKSDVIDTSTRGIKTFTFNEPMVLPRGFYWIALLRNYQGGVIRYRAMRSHSLLSHNLSLQATLRNVFTFEIPNPDFNNPLTGVGLSFSLNVTKRVPIILFPSP